MTVALSAEEIAARLNQQFPGGIVGSSRDSITVSGDALLNVALFLRTTPGLDFDFLSNITAVDYFDCFEVIYQLVSLQHNHGLVLRARCYGRDNPALPSLVSVWRGAELQEREIYDLMGIAFEGHPNMRRIVLWEGFKGHPLRKDYLEWQ